MKEGFSSGFPILDKGEDIRIVPSEDRSSYFQPILFKMGSFSRITWLRQEFSSGDWVETRFSGWKIYRAFQTITSDTVKKIN